MPAVGLQWDTDLWGDDGVFCQITLTSLLVLHVRVIAVREGGAERPYGVDVDYWYVLAAAPPLRLSGATKRRPVFVGKRLPTTDDADYWDDKRHGPMFVGKRNNPFFVG